MSDETLDLGLEPEPDPVPPRKAPAGTHPVNVLHLVMGVAFLGLVAIWALVESSAASASDLRWLLPLPWVLAGAAGLVAAAPRMRGARD
jgi:hypothetical protein